MQNDSLTANKARNKKRKKTNEEHNKRKERDFEDRIRKSYATPEDREALLKKMWEIAKDPFTLTVTHLAMSLDYTPGELYNIVGNHYELKKDWEKIKIRIALNAFNGIERKDLNGTYSKYSLKFLKEIKDEVEKEKAENHRLELEKIKARKDNENNRDLPYIFVEIDGKKVKQVPYKSIIKNPNEEE